MQLKYQALIDFVAHSLNWQMPFVLTKEENLHVNIQTWGSLTALNLIGINLHAWNKHTHCITFDFPEIILIYSEGQNGITCLRFHTTKQGVFKLKNGIYSWEPADNGK